MVEADDFRLMQVDRPEHRRVCRSEWTLAGEAGH
jgi:hypothetical protein